MRTQARIPAGTRVGTMCLAIGIGVLMSGCAAYTNASLCKQKMAATYPATSPKLSYEFPRAGTGGVHAVAEATYKEKIISLKPNPNDSTDPGQVIEQDVSMPAAVECTFDGNTMTTFRWLVPEKFAYVYKDVPDFNGEVPKVAVQNTAFPEEASAPAAASSAMAK